MEKFNGARVLVTGACGTIGSQLVQRLVESGVEQVVCVDNNESDLFYLMEKHRVSGKVVCYLADVRDRRSLSLRMQGVDVVLHAAALKHVGLCEESPTQAIRTNIDGTQNVIDAAIENKVARVIFTSSDKAVNPTNVMGASKQMGERLMTAASESNHNSSTIFASTRFGNVLGSRGSVVPLFRRQILDGGPITLTDRRMTRFVMTLSEAAALVLDSVWIAEGGEVMVTKMPVVRIEDIALVMRDALAPDASLPIVEVGSKPGEKMYEELMNDEEVRRTFEYGDFFVIVSAFTGVSNRGRHSYLTDSAQPHRPYNSSHEPALDLTEVADYFATRRLLA